MVPSAVHGARRVLFNASFFAHAGAVLTRLNTVTRLDTLQQARRRRAHALPRTRAPVALLDALAQPGARYAARRTPRSHRARLRRVASVLCATTSSSKELGQPAQQLKRFGHEVQVRRNGEASQSARFLEHRSPSLADMSGSGAIDAGWWCRLAQETRSGTAVRRYGGTAVRRYGGTEVRRYGI